ncbi:MAG: exodeoxyribonuclease V subunit gamma [Pseudonocardia sp.]|uniref:exodeoxyribonuclease V subunit gamma n=1 Tax=Pseudonocardia sp. TaxID=60912 RepID=UPI001AC64676|nr:exodeoxyribonuclease V subunit gamma [Pseudonocardia sp.]MBN9103326.1 exodeoxyribonuclease V subunit gamma [Pseudonocardia sp.]
MTFQVHRAERAGPLADALGALLSEPLPDPFATEVVAVPAKGVERWLAQRLSHRLGAGAEADGICAGVAFPSPGSVLDAAVDAAAGVDPAEDPWRPSRAVWPLLEVVDESAGQAWCAPLGTHLHGDRRGRRYATARRLAELFASYAAFRPEMVRGWAVGLDGVPPDLAWQPELWRRLRARIGVPGPAERLATACEVLRSDPGVARLPSRISVFGATRLGADELAVLAALSEHRDVHLWLPHPSPALWERVANAGGVPLRRAEAGLVAAHPLLSSLGRDVRELQVRLLAAAPGLVHHHHAGPEPAPTLLGRLQRDLRDDHRSPPAPIDPGDESIRVHSCHGPDRQVEVLREIVLGLLEADPTLEPRDIAVMCPDIETFAPLVSAAFGDGGPTAHPGRQLAVRLADRALRQLNPLLDTVSRLLELAGARLTASEVLDLLASGPVRHRFRLDDDDLDRLRELATSSGVRWGLDGAHRAPYRLDGFGQNTWAAGLDRLLLGVTMSGADHTWLGTALPLAELESGDTERIGRLAEFVDRLATVLGGLSGEQPLTAWIEALTRGLDLLTDTTPTDAWQAAQARSELAEAARAAGPHASGVPLGLADVRGLLAERLRGRPSRSNFRTGALTVATMVPMRSVPHRVVCLLGLDDGTFPRAGIVDGDDVLARDPHVGERDPRSEDRQLLLDAICAAGERLVVIHSGADERTGARRPPAVPLGEVLDAIGPVEGVVVRHPLQPFDPRNFTPGRPFSFDRVELAGARAAAAPKAAPPAFVVAPLAPVVADTVALDDLVSFLEHPVKGFLRQRVGLSLFAGDDEPADALPVEPNGLATWAIGDRLLRDRLAGLDLDRCRQAEWRRGELPPGALGDALLTRVLDDVEPLVAAAATVRRGEADDRDVDVTLPDGTRVAGTLGGLHEHTLLRVEFSRLAPKQRVRAWVRLLALTATTGDPWRAVTLGRGTRFGLAMATVGPVGREPAVATLADLVELYREGLREPLPLTTQGGHAYARTRSGGGPDDALAEAMRLWSTGAGAERADDAHVRVWGTAAPPGVIAGPPGPAGGEPTRFGSLALRLWSPLLISEEVVRR